MMKYVGLRKANPTYATYEEHFMTYCYNSRSILISCGLVALLFGAQSKAATLTTPTFVITIMNKCEIDKEANDCDTNVYYTAVNRKNKKSTHLKGRDLFYYCPDDQGDGAGKTPCHHVGYEFQNGDTIYSITDDGNLEVKQDSKVLLHEKGKWD
jgi:hypothetical protein